MNRFSAWRLLASAWKIFVLRRRLPLLVTMRVTHRCGFRCVYCHFDQMPLPDPSTEEIKRIILQARAAGALKFGFSGGEPLARADIGELIRTAADAGLATTLTSNGWSVPERIDALQHLDILVLSLDGMKETHDRQRKKGSFDKVLAACRLCRARGIKVLGLTVLTRHNLQEVEPLLAVAEQEGFWQIFQPVESRDFFRAELDDIAPEPAAFRATIDALIAAKKAGRPVYNSFAYLEFLKKWPHPSLFADRCWAGRISCVINTDGALLPCNNLTTIDTFGNTLRDPFATAFSALGHYRCQGCWTNCYQENNLLMNVDPRAVQAAIARVWWAMTRRKRRG
ncbi:MAG: radical SAM protein [Magnetococcales bacterium]|nr:radical SAM protein [Magnetococcales bacterium]